MRPLIALACLLALCRPAVCAQARPRPPRLEPGARIRFDATNLGASLTGTLVRLASDTLIVEVDGHAAGLGMIVAADSVTRIDVQAERRMTLEGMGAGVLAGTLLALAASPDVVDDNGNCTTLECLSYQVSPNLDTRLAVLGFAGALLGTILGSETKTASWAPVNLERLHVGGTPDGGLAFGVRLSF